MRSAKSILAIVLFLTPLGGRLSYAEDQQPDAKGMALEPAMGWMKWGKA